MPMTLFYVPQTRAVRVRWLLEELGVPYELHRLDPSKRETHGTDYLKLNPLGQVPTLRDGDAVLTESLAICHYLADKFADQGLAPEPGIPARAEYERWMAFSMVALERWVDTVNQHQVRLPEAERVPAVIPWARRRFDEAARVLTDALGGRQVLVGDRFTVADLMTASVLGWARLLGMLEEHPLLVEYCRPHFSRPAAKRSRAD
jgi:glutathione S-transferase